MPIISQRQGLIFLGGGGHGSLQGAKVEGGVGKGDGKMARQGIATQVTNAKRAK